MESIKSSLLGTYKYYRYNLENIFSEEEKILRSMPLYTNFIFHVEEISSDKSFSSLLEFAKKLNQETGVRLIACIKTAINPMSKISLAKESLTEKDYIKRVTMLTNFCDIGYHGHFPCYTEDSSLARQKSLEFLGTENFSRTYDDKLLPTIVTGENEELLQERIHNEIEWLRKYFYQPRIYSAGFWYITEKIISLLEENGIEADSSIRKKHKDSFGSNFLNDEDYPQRGIPFILKPSRNIIEIQSAFYLVEHSKNTQKYLQETFSLLPEKPLFLFFPSHETELIKHKKEMYCNLKYLASSPNIKLANLDTLISKAMENINCYPNLT